MKVRSRRIFAMVAGVMALGALSWFAGPASASGSASPRPAATPSPPPWTHLCAAASGIWDACVDAAGSGNWVQMHELRSSTTNWTYPRTVGAIGTIKQANVNLCMQLDAADNYLVRGAPCVGDFAEEWINKYDSFTHSTQFESYWALLQYGADYCMQANLTSLSPDTTGIVQLTACDDEAVSQGWATAPD
jgi:hypothetical protein